ncbi:carboxypeptidase regulatory-like domain-containing protein [Planctopirus limnophila]|uniref:carboxypeptidase regulatory-like domain-containing protein n=1 Tax=Planctopirus limnophila TaxID=120 RepID=UPI00031A1D80|nr:carboxypeptidase regulatory-like domain-containing protein [Planctopirus limnophila]
MALMLPVIGLAVVLGSPLYISTKWVGHADLRVRFAVVDAATGEPIPGAMVHIRAERGGLCADCEAREFTLTTDRNGHAEELVTQCLTFGSRSHWENTWFIHLPSWRFQITADGFESLPATTLSESEYMQLAERGYPTAQLTVPVKLRRIEE